MGEPGRHFFMTRGATCHKHLKIKIICAAKQFSIIIYHITVWGICCLLRRCRAQKLCEKWKGDATPREVFYIGNKFGVLTHFPSLADEELAEQCNALGTTLHFEGHSDLDSRELVLEIKNFPHLPSKTMSLLELITFMHDNDLSEIHPNVWTALRIALTLPVTVSQAERSVDQVVPEVNRVSGPAHWPCYHQYQGADFVWWHYWWFSIKEGQKGQVLVCVFCS